MQNNFLLLDLSMSEFYSQHSLLYGTNLSPRKIPVTMSKKSLSLSGEQTIAFVFLSYIISATTVSLGWLYASSIYFIFPLCMESNSLEKFTNISLVTNFFARNPSMAELIIGICEVVDQFFLKPFFFLRISSIPC